MAVVIDAVSPQGPSFSSDQAHPVHQLPIHSSHAKSSLGQRLIEEFDGLKPNVDANPARNANPRNDVA